MRDTANRTFTELARIRKAIGTSYEVQSAAPAVSGTGSRTWTAIRRGERITADSPDELIARIKG